MIDKIKKYKNQVMIAIPLNIISGLIVGIYELPIQLMLIPFIINVEIFYIRFLGENWYFDEGWFFKKILSVGINVYLTGIFGLVCTLIPSHLKETFIGLIIILGIIIFFLINYHISKSR